MKRKNRRGAIKDLRLGLLQIDSKPQDVEVNLAKILDRVSKAAARGANLIIAPELVLSGFLFSGFLFSREEYLTVAQTIPGPATEEVGAEARKANAYIIFGLPEKSGQDLYNSLAIVGPGGELLASYRKLNLWVNEKGFFVPG